jgi:hypothetical protein
VRFDAGQARTEQPATLVIGGAQSWSVAEEVDPTRDIRHDNVAPVAGEAWQDRLVQLTPPPTPIDRPSVTVMPISEAVAELDDPTPRSNVARVPAPLARPSDNDAAVDGGDPLVLRAVARSEDALDNADSVGVPVNLSDSVLDGASVSEISPSLSYAGLSPSDYPDSLAVTEPWESVTSRPYYLHLSIVADRTSGEQLLAKVRGKHKGLLRDLGQRLVAVDDGYEAGPQRAQLGPVADPISAEAMCQALALYDQDCEVTR